MTSFAENQLKKYGWTKGQGLGKNSEGRKTPITVIKKNNTHGLGDNSEDWSFEWWNKVYTKTLDNIKVSKTSDGEVKVSKVIKESTVPRNHVGIISTSESLYSLSDSSTFATTSTHKSRFDDDETNGSSCSNLKTKSLFYYGNFIKSSTGPLDLNGWNKPIKRMEINDETKSADRIGDSVDVATTSNSLDMSHEEKREKSRKKKRKFEENIILAKNEKKTKKKIKNYKKKTF